MRHKIFGRKLNRDIKERKALFKNLILSLITYGKIKTTLAKAKAIRPLAEKMVRKAVASTDSTIRQVSSFLGKKEAINKLVTEIAPRFKKTLGGYLRIRRIGKRQGDRSEQVILEWSVEEEKKIEDKPGESKNKKKVEKTKKKDYS